MKKSGNNNPATSDKPAEVIEGELIKKEEAPADQQETSANKTSNSAETKSSSGKGTTTDSATAKPADQKTSANKAQQKPPGAKASDAPLKGVMLAAEYSESPSSIKPRSVSSSSTFEGKPVRTPDPGAFWRVCEEYNVDVLRPHRYEAHAALTHRPSL